VLLMMRQSGWRSVIDVPAGMGSSTTSKMYKICFAGGQSSGKGGEHRDVKLTQQGTRVVCAGLKVVLDKQLPAASCRRHASPARRLPSF